MNNTFNLKRFGLLFKKTLLERPVQTFGVTALLLTLVFLLYVITKSLAGFNAAQNLTFIWGLPGGSFFLASMVFGYFNSNASGSSYLTLPASLFEKWLSGVLIAGILYPAIFLLFYYLVDNSFVALYHNHLDPASPFYKDQYEAVYPFNLNGIIAWKVYPMFLFLTGAMFTGALYFNRAAFIKTGIALCVLVIAVFAVNWLMAKLLFGEINDAGPFDHVTLAVGKEDGSIILPQTAHSIFYYSIWYFIPAMLWVISLVRLREKEF
jgi:hypothetical protein